jgi:hypothetical protein
MAMPLNVHNAHAPGSLAPLKRSRSRMRVRPPSVAAKSRRLSSSSCKLVIELGLFRTWIRCRFVHAGPRQTPWAMQAPEVRGGVNPPASGHLLADLSFKALGS